MKRLLLGILSFAIGGAALMAQQTTKTIKGMVIDPNGNPVPGAMVQATGGADTSVTDADGSYEMEVPFFLKSITVTYPGYKKRKTNLDSAPYYVTQLKGRGGRKGLCGFLNAVGGCVFPIDAFDDTPQFQVGLMGGATWNGWGGYAKLLMRVAGSNDYDSNYDWRKVGGYGVAPTITLGFIRQFSNVFGLFAGVGVQWNPDAWEEVIGYKQGDSYNYSYDRFYHLGTDLRFAAELGVMFNFNKHVNCIVGLTYSLPNGNDIYGYESYGDTYHRWDGYSNSGILTPFIGIGYTFAR